MILFKILSPVNKISGWAFIFLLFTEVLSAQSFDLSGIVSENDSRGVPFASVVIDELNRGTACDSLGFFQFSDVPIGSYHLHVDAIGYIHTEIEIEIRSDTIIRIPMRKNRLYIDEVVVQDEFNQRIDRSGTQTVDRLGGDLLSLSIGNNLAQSLESISGVRSMNTGAGIGKPVIRGFTGTRIVVNHNGLAQEGQQWGMEHGLEIDPFSSEQIEIIKGAQAIAYGSDAMGGVVNILPSPIPTKNTINGRIQSIYKSNNHHVGAAVNLDVRDEKRFYRIRLSSQRYQDYRVPAEEFIYNTTILRLPEGRMSNTAGEESNIFLSMGRIWDSGNLEFSYSRYALNAGIFAGAMGIPRQFQLTPDGSWWDIDLPVQLVKHQKASMRWNQRWKKVRMVANAGVQYNEREERTRPDFHGIVADSLTTLGNGLDLLTASANTKFYWHIEPVHFISGASFQTQKNIRDGFEFIIPEFQHTEAGLFHVVQYKRDKWTYEGGLRWDFGYYDIVGYDREVLKFENNEIVFDSLDTRVRSFQRTFSNFSGSVGLNFEPSENWTFKTNLSRSFRVPNIAEIAANGVHHGTFRHEQGDSTLSSERGWMLEVTGIRTWERFTLRLNPYLNYFDNYIFLRPSARFSYLPDGGQLYVYTEANVLHTGAELNAYWDIDETWSTELIGAYLYTYNFQSNLALPFTPPGDFTFAVNYAKPIKSNFLRIRIENRWVMAQNRTDRNERSTPETFLQNAVFSYQIPFVKSQLLIGMRLSNAWNTPFYDHLSRYRLLNLPEQGRNFIAQIKFTF
jgi:iron complex outermembrane receptor protein